MPFPALLLLLGSLAAISETDFAATFDRDVRPWVAAHVRTAVFTNRAGVRIAHAVARGTVAGTAVFVTGHGESHVRYRELLYDLQDANRTMRIVDPRGTGLSDRALPDRDKDHVDDAAAYARNLDEYLEREARLAEGEKITLGGHSLGCCVAAAYAEAHPERVRALFLSSPFLGSAAGRPAVALLKTLDFFGFGRSYVPGRGPYAATPFEKISRRGAACAMNGNARTSSSSPRRGRVTRRSGG